MTSPEGAVRDREDSGAAALVEAAVQSLTRETRQVWLPVSDMREIPEVRAILESPDDVRRECILLAAGRDDGYCWADCRDAVSPTVHLFSMITRRHVELACADIEALLAFPRAELDRNEVWWLSEKARVLSRNIEGAYAGLNDDDKARVKPLLERVAAEVGHTPTAVRIRKLIGTSREIRYELIDDGDDVGPRLRAVIEASPEPDEARAAVLNLLAAFPASGRAAEEVACRSRTRPELARPAGRAQQWPARRSP